MTNQPRQSENEQRADADWMRVALVLAEESIGLASPNPAVGCVLIKDEAVVGRGAHVYDQLAHAEIVALGEAGEQARGATAYVTLEPCSHVGRTGPCADALVRAGVARVVAATVDPNPAVSGRGMTRLREAGIAVTTGVLVEQARRLNDGFARHIRSKLPFVTLKAGLSLDGRIAPAPIDTAPTDTGRTDTGPAGTETPPSTTYLTSADSLLAVQQMRHAADAIITGIGTVLHDDPLLTDRTGLPRRRRLLRVVLDSALRIPLGSRLVESAQGDLLVYTADAASAKAEVLRRAGVEIEAVPTTVESGAPREADRVARGEPQPRRGAIAARVEGEESNASHHQVRDTQARLDLHAVLVSLGQRSILNLLAEGGSRLNRALLAEERVDKLCLFYAPLLLGEQGVPLVAGAGSLSPEMSKTTVTRSGDDFRFEAYLRDPWC